MTIDRMARGVLACAALIAIGAAPQATPPAAPPATSASRADPRVPMVALTIVGRHPHDAQAFTQGLLWHGDSLYESTGRQGRSEVRRVALDSGRVVARAAIPRGQFGEGLALWKATLISLTWTSGVAHRWDVATLQPRGELAYRGEGWGLASAPDGVILSDGSDTLRVLDPETFAERRRVKVTIAGRKLDELNELEMVDGELLANVWHTPYIVAIDPTTGKVTRVLDARALVAEVGATDSEAVLNGIAWDAQRRRLFVTGKLWPTLFEVALPPRVS